MWLSLVFPPLCPIWSLQFLFFLCLFPIFLSNEIVWIVAGWVPLSSPFDAVFFSSVHEVSVLFSVVLLFAFHFLLLLSNSFLALVRTIFVLFWLVLL